MFEIIQREFIYIWYYFTLQFKFIFWYWLAGMLIGSAVSVFLKNRIHELVRKLPDRKYGLIGIVISSVLGIVSPLCLYGTVPIAASFSKSGVKDDWLAAFMMSSILLNPQLVIYSAALGKEALIIRIVSCLVCGICAGAAVHFFCRKGNYFNFDGFSEPKNRDTDKNVVMRYLKNFGRNVKATGVYFLVGILLAALFQRYVPVEVVQTIFGGDKTCGVLIAASIGVPLYVCGGGTVPLLQEWLTEGMSLGSAAAFMLTGPATKITNLGALKIVLGVRNFILYLVFVMLFSCLTGLLVNWFF